MGSCLRGSESRTGPDITELMLMSTAAFASLCGPKQDTFASGILILVVNQGAKCLWAK